MLDRPTGYYIIREDFFAHPAAMPEFIRQLLLTLYRTTPAELRSQMLAGQDIRKSLLRALRLRVDAETGTTLKKDEADEFFNQLIGFHEVADHDANLPADSTPYVATSVSAILKMLSVIKPGQDDVLCDVGAGLFRIPILVNLLTGIDTIGVEMDTELCREARSAIDSCQLDRVELIEGDACGVDLSRASIFSFNLPFEEASFNHFIRKLGEYSDTRPITIYPYCWHYYFWDIPWLKAMQIGATDEYYFISR